MTEMMPADEPWESSGWEILSIFSAPPDSLDGARIYRAVYIPSNDYSFAHVVYERDGKLYEVYECHREKVMADKWRPRETTWQEIAMRPDEESFVLASVFFDFEADLKLYGWLKCTTDIPRSFEYSLFGGRMDRKLTGLDNQFGDCHKVFSVWQERDLGLFKGPHAAWRALRSAILNGGVCDKSNVGSFDRVSYRELESFLILFPQYSAVAEPPAVIVSDDEVPRLRKLQDEMFENKYGR